MIKMQERAEREAEMEQLLQQLDGKLSKSLRQGKRARSSDHHLMP